MPNLIPYPKFKAVDALGVPYSGGKVYTYLAGSDTAKATYTTSACSVANANPVVLDSAGEATIYGKGYYKIVLKTSADVTVWTQDNVAGMGYWPSPGTYQADYSETDQGATGAGGTLKALVDAIAAENATILLQHNSGGATTTYTLSTSLTIPANVSLQFENGARISIDAGKTLTVNGIIEAGDWIIFTSTGTVGGAPKNAVIPDIWFDTGITITAIGAGTIRSIGAAGDEAGGNMLILRGTAATPTWVPIETVHGKAKKLYITRTSATSVTLTATSITVSASGIPHVVDGINETAAITSSGAGGLDTGTEANSTWYYIWAIYNVTTDTVKLMLSVSATSPTLPTGYTYYELYGCVYNDSSGNFLDFDQFDDTYLYVLPKKVSDGGGTTTTAELDLSASVPVATILKSLFGKTMSNTGALTWLLSPITFANSTGVDNDIVPIQISFTAATLSFPWHLPIMTSTSVFHQVTANTVDIWVTGFTLR